MLAKGDAAQDADDMRKKLVAVPTRATAAPSPSLRCPLTILLQQLSLPRMALSRLHVRFERMRPFTGLAAEVRASCCVGVFVSWRAQSIRCGQSDTVLFLQQDAFVALRDACQAAGLKTIDNTAFARACGTG